jgi:hypothetical protein
MPHILIDPTHHAMLRFSKRVEIGPSLSRYATVQYILEGRVIGMVVKLQGPPSSVTRLPPLL